MNTQEQKRMMVLNRLLVGQLTAVEAAVLLKLSQRQVRRLLAAYQKEGAAALIHGNRDRKPVRSISEQVRRQVIELASTKYVGCNSQHLRDLLAERERIELSRASVRRILLAAGTRSPRTQRRRQHRRRRVRYAQEGMLAQIDGSRHAWLEERGLYWLLGTCVRKKPLYKLQSMPSLVAKRRVAKVKFEGVNWYSHCNKNINASS